MTPSLWGSGLIIQSEISARGERRTYYVTFGHGHTEAERAAVARRTSDGWHSFYHPRKQWSTQQAAENHLERIICAGHYVD